MAFGVAEPCSRLRRFGGALSEPFDKTHDRLRELAVESANRPGNPKGHDRANMALGPFAKAQGPRLPARRNPGNYNYFLLKPIPINFHLDKNSNTLPSNSRISSLPKNKDFLLFSWNHLHLNYQRSYIALDN